MSAGEDCRFRLIASGATVIPRSCPRCGIFGICHFGLVDLIRAASPGSLPVSDLRIPMPPGATPPRPVISFQAALDAADARQAADPSLPVPLPDFRQLPHTYPPENRYDFELRRYDLATLRQCYRSITGVEDGYIIAKASRKRLIAAGLLDRLLCRDGCMRTFATQRGKDAVLANVTCVDGSESYPL